jgi:integrase
LLSVIRRRYHADDLNDQGVDWPSAAATARWPVEGNGSVVAVGLDIKAHAHMLRHGCGCKLANDGHDTRAIQAYLGHRNIQNTTRCTALAPQRFNEFFRDSSARTRHFPRGSFTWK